jgi:nitroreductase
MTSSVADTIRARRTNLRIDRDRAVDQATITELIELATWAPNHHLTEPWRFAVLTDTARSTLGETVAQHMIDHGQTEPGRLEKARSKFLRAPVILMVASDSDTAASPEVRAEDRDAVAAAVQNILLGASAAGLNSYWGSGAVCEAPKVKSLCGFTESAIIIAAIYLGHSIGDVPLPQRKAAIVRWVTS